jgi:hypothetical protein
MMNLLSVLPAEIQNHVLVSGGKSLMSRATSPTHKEFRLPNLTVTRLWVMWFAG